MRTKSGSIYQDKKTGRYRAMLSTAAGRPSKYFDTKQEAADWLAKQQNAILTGTYVEPSAITLGIWLTTWLRDYKKDTLSQRTFERYIDFAKKCRPISHYRLQQLTAPIVQSFYSQLKSDGLGASSIIKVHKMVKQAMDKALKVDLVSRNVLYAVDPPKPPPQKEIQTFTREELDAILQAAEGYAHGRYVPLLHLAIATGCRMGELLALRWSDFNIKRHEISITRNLQHSKIKGLIFNPPKTKAGIRTITIPAKTAGILLEHKIPRKVEPIHNLIFRTATGKPCDPHNIERAWRTIVRSLDIPYRNFHVLRHTHATDLLAAGIPIVEVAHRLGHARISHTLELYGHAIPRYDQQIADTVAKLYLVK